MSTFKFKFFNDSNESFRLDMNRLKTAGKLMSHDFKKQFGWVNFIALTEEEHIDINTKFLFHNYSTDVITFDFSDSNLINGEIYFNPRQVQLNALEYGVKFKNEAYRVCVHGLLHLLGLDDSTPNQRTIMRKLEDKYLSSFM